MKKNLNKTNTEAKEVKKEEVKEMEVKNETQETSLVANSEAVNQETKVEEQAPSTEGTQENPAPQTEEGQALEVKEEEKKEEVKEEVKEEKKVDLTKKELSESEKSMTIINGLIAKNQGLKIVASESKTGWSFFSGKKRLCKLLKTKRGVTLEINVSLPQQFKEMAEMENISATMAFKKHLGTMKHLYRANDSKMVSAIMKEAIAIFKAEMEAAKAQEQAEEKKAANQ